MESIISLHQVSKSFSGRRVLSNVSLEIEKGSTVGIAQAIMEHQDILILDEPFNALDYKT